MQAVIVAFLALTAIVVMEAGYCIAMSLVRWTPALAIGAIVGWLSYHHGLDGLEALGLGIFACLIARRVMLALLRGALV